MNIQTMFVTTFSKVPKSHQNYMVPFQWGVVDVPFLIKPPILNFIKPPFWRWFDKIQFHSYWKKIVSNGKMCQNITGHSTKHEKYITYSIWTLKLEMYIWYNIGYFDYVKKNFGDNISQNKNIAILYGI